MTKWFRSAEMDQVIMLIQESMAHDTLYEIGKLSCVHFLDLNWSKTSFERRKASSIKRCNELERVLSYLGNELKALNVYPKVHPDYDLFLRDYDAEKKAQPDSNMRFQAMESELTEVESTLRELNGTFKRLVYEYNNSKEHKYALLQMLRNRVRSNKKKNTGIRNETLYGAADAESEWSDFDTGVSKTDRVRFNQVVGTVRVTDKRAFERIVFRYTRNSCFIKFYEIYDSADSGASLSDVGIEDDDDDSGESKLAEHEDSDGNLEKTNDSGQIMVKFIDPETRQPEERVIFVALFPGKAVEQKLRRICKAFGARVYGVPDLYGDEESRTRVQELIESVTQDHEGVKEIMKLNRKKAKSIGIAAAAKFYGWRSRVKTEKAVFHTMNKCLLNRSGFLVAKGWVLRNQIDEVSRIVRNNNVDTSSSGTFAGSVTRVDWKESGSVPPTYFKTNKVTQVFQDTVDTYGVPRYGEANPSVSTTVTFPFLFGVMFGDLGHGSLILLVALFLVLKEDWMAHQLKTSNNALFKEMGGMLYGGRYLLLFMGCCSAYMGLLYNEFFSLTLNLFGSTWDVSGQGNGVMKGKYGETVYPFGMDPQWLVSVNELAMVNSFKMKLAVIIGVSQMTLGVFHKLSNYIHFRDWICLVFEAIPQIIFISAIFNYMNFLIVYKWWQNWDLLQAKHIAPPSIINTVISMALQGGDLGGEPALFDGQVALQTKLLAAAVISVPTMFFAPPLLKHYVFKKKGHGHAHGDGDESTMNGGKKYDSLRADIEANDEESGLADKAEETDAISSAVADTHGGGGHGHEEEGIGDMIIHQCIEGIEYVLGCVSNTASYLRLWALSLAHAELAKTFWNMVMSVVIVRDSIFNFIFVFLAYSMFACCTIAVLMLMDMLECYLHALRLQWVEFQNKFFKADGYAFAPFSHKKVLSEDD
eukprot:g4899.t1